MVVCEWSAPMLRDSSSHNQRRRMAVVVQGCGERRKTPGAAAKVTRRYVWSPEDDAVSRRSWEKPLGRGHDSRRSDCGGGVGR